MNLSQNVAHDAAMNTAIDYADRMINEVLVMPPAPVEEPLVSPEQWRVYNRMTKAERFAAIYEARLLAYEIASAPGQTGEAKRLMRKCCRALNELEFSLHDGRQCRIERDTKHSAIWFLMSCHEEQDTTKH